MSRHHEIVCDCLSCARARVSIHTLPEPRSYYYYTVCAVLCVYRVDLPPRTDFVLRRRPWWYYYCYHYRDRYPCTAVRYGWAVGWPRLDPFPRAFSPVAPRHTHVRSFADPTVTRWTTAAVGQGDSISHDVCPFYGLAMPIGAIMIRSGTARITYDICIIMIRVRIKNFRRLFGSIF